MTLSLRVRALLIPLVASLAYCLTSATGPLDNSKGLETVQILQLSEMVEIQGGAVHCGEECTGTGWVLCGETCTGGYWCPEVEEEVPACEPADSSDLCITSGSYLALGTMFTHADCTGDTYIVCVLCCPADLCGGGVSC